jgi:hypothetical protein
MSRVSANGWLSAVVALHVAATQLSAARAQTSASAPPPAASDESRRALEVMVARLIHRAIPQDYDKKKDWDATKEIPVGVRIKGKPFHWHAHRRTKAVNHGVWKHYKVRILDPSKDLAVTVSNLRPLSAGRAAATLQIDAKIDVWARAKVYEYGVHLIALELEGDTRVRLVIEGELRVRFQSVGGLPAMVLEPKAISSRVLLENFHIRRVSDAKGPLVRELGDSVPKLLTEELQGPELTDKINRAGEKKRDRLVLNSGEWMASWLPFAGAPPTAPPVSSPVAAGRE